jgi:phosphoribosylcarboxyaminoimidazole (NCAIR) mutase
VQQNGASAVDEERAQVAVAALGDSAESALEAARVLARREAEIAGKVSSGREATHVADLGGHPKPAIDGQLKTGH